MLVRSDYLTESVDSILNNAVYLTESETMNNPAICPVIENSRLGIYIAPFTSVSGLMEAYDIDGDTALAWVAESNGVDPNAITVSINDYDIIAEPKIVNEFSHYVVNPISEDSAAYQLMEACLDGYFDTGDEGYLGYYVENALFDEETDYKILAEAEKAMSGGVGSTQLLLPYKPSFYKRHKTGVKIGAGLAGAAAIAGGVAAYKNRKQIISAISAKIAALRGKQQKIEEQIPVAPPEKKNVLQRALDKIKQMINALLEKLKNLKNKIKDKFSK